MSRRRAAASVLVKAAGSAVFPFVLQKLTEPDVPDAAEIDRELADELSEIADEMRKDREQESGSESESGAAGSQGPAYRYRVRYEEISDDPCQFCLDLLRELESFPVEEQQEAVPVFTEGIGALEAGAEMEDVKEVWSESDVLKEAMKELGVEI